MTKNNEHVKSLKARRKAAGLTMQGLPKGYRENAALLASIA